MQIDYDKIMKECAEDTKFMEMAVIIAESNIDEITNQGVGAIIVKDEKIVGTGCRHIFKNFCGKDHKCVHAEHMAIQEAGIVNANGATLYATTEPCTKRWHNSISWHFPSCCQLILKYDISRVVIGNCDENFGHGGLEWLTDNGIIVDLVLDFEDRIKAISNRKVDSKVQNEYEQFKRLMDGKNIW